MKIELELVVHEEPDGRKFLNYWDYYGGNDVCCEIKDDKLFKSEYDEEGNELPKKEISFPEFMNLVEAVIFLNKKDKDINKKVEKFTDLCFKSRTKDLTTEQHLEKKKLSEELVEDGIMTYDGQYNFVNKVHRKCFQDMIKKTDGDSA